MAPASPGLTRPFYARIESLRGLGMLAVAGYHFSGAGIHGTAFLHADHWLPRDPLQVSAAKLSQWFLPGHACLMLFFVISGCVLSEMLRYGPPTLLRAAVRFVISRLFRFYPIVLAGTLAAMIVNPAAADSLTPRKLFENLLLLDVTLNGHLWALQFELLMVPVIFALFVIDRRIGPWPVFAVAAGSSLLVFNSRLAGWPPLGVNGFAVILGMVVPTLGRSFVERMSRRSAQVVLMAAGIVFLGAGPCLGFYSRLTTLAEGFGAAMLLSVVIVRHDLPVLRVLDANVLIRFGTAAGSYYVLHMATAPLFLPLAQALIPASWSLHVPTLVGGLAVPLWLLAVIPVALAFHAFVERPGMELGRWVHQGLTRRDTTANVPWRTTMLVTGLMRRIRLRTSAE